MKTFTLKDFVRWGRKGGKSNSKEHMKRIAQLPRKLKVKCIDDGEVKFESVKQ